MYDYVLAYKFALKEATDGVSVLPSEQGKLASPPAESIAVAVPTAGQPYIRPVIAIRSDDWKAIWRKPGWADGPHRRVGEDRELYDLTNDPGELENLAELRPDVWLKLKESAEHLEILTLGTQKLSPEALEALRRLGYAE